MCTVTITPKGNNNFILTSNRDEAPNRIPLPPKFYKENDTSLLFPKDPVAEGTWIGISDKNRVVCLLNGGFIIHERKSTYRKSRGLISKDFLLASNIETTLNDYNLDNIEPFTLVIADWNTSLKFYELVWDGEKKHISQLPLEPKIWSSATLYSKTMKQERLTWFNDFKTKLPLTPENLLSFHKTAGDGNNDYGTVMNRGSVKTTSITQIKKLNNNVEIRYENLQNNEVSIKEFNFQKTINA